MNQLDIFQPFDKLNRFEESAPTATHYNTTALTGEDLRKARVKAGGQKEKILQFFQDHPRTSFTPAQVHLHFGQQMVLNSVRRCITDLTTEGLLEKTEERRQGLYGSDNFTWRLKAI